MRIAFLMLVLMSAAPVQAQRARDVFRDMLEVPDRPPAPELSVVVMPVRPPAEVQEPVSRSWRPRSKTLNWVDYSILAATGAAAVVAIHYKTEADARYDRYRQTGDATLRPEIRALDRRAGIALVGMQAGVTVFGVRLLLR